MEYKKLEDIIEFNPTETLKKGTVSKKIPMDKLDVFSKYINSFDIEKYNGGMKFRNGDTLLARITPCLENGKTSKVTILDEEEVGFGSTEYIVMRSKKNISDEDFIFYLAISPKFREIAIKSMTGTSGRQRVQLDVVKNTEMLIPSYEEQIKIGKVLSSIDKRIELNNQINDNLLELINDLYKESFSNTKEYKQADEIANITIGKTPPRSNRECFTYNEDDIKWLSISDLGKCGMYAWNTSEKLTENSVNKYNVKVITENTIVLSFKLTIGRIAITANKMATNEAIAHFNLLDNDMIYYLYFYLKNFDYSKLGNTSSIAIAVNSKIIKAMPIGIPNKNSILEFNNIVRPLFEKIKLNEEQNMTLTQLRDTLLPKLMNGEIDLDKIEI